MPGPDHSPNSVDYMRDTVRPSPSEPLTLPHTIAKQ
jgi:hypothetical protein